MKEAFWGVLIILLGLFGIVVVNIFQNVTVDNDRVYYLIKESTEASAYDALDLTYYRLSGKLRIAEDKFVENLTRRFAENVTIGDYKIVVEDINEMPPKVSLRVRSGVATLRGEKFGIVNRVDGILETKYKLDEVLDFLGITKEEWNEKTEGSTIEKDPNTGENICKVVTKNKDEIECIPGDIKFAGFEDADIAESVCQDETPSGAKERKVKYKVCDCGKWVEESETLSASSAKVGNEWVYTWTFNKTGEIRSISESIKSRVKIQICTTSIEEMVPKDIDEAKPKEDGSAHEPSKDNSSYITCPANGIKIPIGMKFVMHPNYVPKESVNRNLEWSTTDSSIVGVIGSNPISTCILDKEGTNCFSRATITAKEVGTAYVNVKTTRNQTASCKVEVFDGKIESIGCKDMTVDVGRSSSIEPVIEPKNSTIINYEYSISDTSVATISGNTVTAKAGGEAKLTIKETNTGKTGTCTVKVPSPPKPPKNYSDYDGGGSGSKGGYWKVTDSAGKTTYYSSYKKAKEAAVKTAGNSSSGTYNPVVISYKNSDANAKEIKYSEVTANNPNKGTKWSKEVIYNGNSTIQSTVSVEKVGSKTTTKTTDKNGKVTTKVTDSSSKSGGDSSCSSCSCGYNCGSYYDKNKGNLNSGAWVSPANCFLSGTKVLTNNGYKNIETIQQDDLVLSYNETTHQNEYKTVEKVFAHKNVSDVIYTFTILNQKIEVSSNHRIYIKNIFGYRWDKAENIKVGDILMDSDGNYHPIIHISSREIVDNLYNIEVKDNHNYYVSTSNILVHNRK